MVPAEPEPEPEPESGGRELWPGRPATADRQESPDDLGSALGLAYRHLGRRDRTEAEIRAHLHRQQVPDGVIERCVAELIEQRYLDDRRFAERFAEDRRRLDGWGTERIHRRLLELGVAGETVDGVLAAGVIGDDREAAVAVLRERVGRAPDDERGRQRALALLVRRGYDLDLAYEVVRKFAGEGDRER